MNEWIGGVAQLVFRHGIDPDRTSGDGSTPILAVDSSAWLLETVGVKMRMRMRLTKLRDIHEIHFLCVYNIHFNYCLCKYENAIAMRIKTMMIGDFRDVYNDVMTAAVVRFRRLVYFFLFLKLCVHIVYFWRCLTWFSLTKRRQQF